MAPMTAESVQGKERQTHLYLVATEGGSGCDEEAQEHCISCIECIRELVERVSPDIRDAFDVRHCHVLSPAEPSHQDPAWLRQCGTAFRECMSRIVDRNRRIIILSSVEDAPHIANLITHAAQPNLLSHQDGDATGSVVIAVSPDEAPSERLKVLERAMRASKDRMNGRMSLLIGRRFMPLPGLQLNKGQLTSRFSDMGGVDRTTQNLYFGQEMPEHFPQGSDEESHHHFAVAPVQNILISNGGEDAVNDLYAKILSPEAVRNSNRPLPRGVVFALHPTSVAFAHPSDAMPMTLANNRSIPSILVNAEPGDTVSSDIRLPYVLDGRTKGMNPMEAEIALSHWLGVAEELHGADNPDAVIAYVRKCLDQYLS